MRMIFRCIDPYNIGLKLNEEYVGRFCHCPVTGERKVCIYNHHEDYWQVEYRYKFVWRLEE